MENNSMPNLTQPPENRERARYGDFLRWNRINEIDLLPRDDYRLKFLDFTRGAWNFIYTTAKVLFVVVAIINVAVIFIDSPSRKFLDYLRRGEADKCGVPCKVDNHAKALRQLQHELRDMNVKFAAISREMLNISQWRYEIDFELANFYDNYKKKMLEYSSKVETKLLNALSLYDADKLGIIDYALESAGGSIVSTPDTVPYPTRISYAVMGVVRFYESSNPKLMIRPGNQPGQCFAFHGQTGRIRIRLARAVYVGSVTMEHVHKSLVSDVTSCPKGFKVHGLSNVDEPNGRAEFTDLGEFAYFINGTPLQNFKVVKKPTAFEYVELEILSNYGNYDYTCIYRFRVHGTL